MKKLFVSCVFLLSGVSVLLAQTETVVNDVAEPAANAGTDWGNVAISVLVLVAALAIIAHMVYEYFIKKTACFTCVGRVQGSKKRTRISSHVRC